MSDKFVRIPTIKTATDFRAHVAGLSLDLPCDDRIETTAASPLAKSIQHISINGKKIGNRFAVQPMEGWDGTETGGISDEVVRRWQRFGESGAKLIFGGEAMAVRPDGRANPNQLILSRENAPGLSHLVEALRAAHRQSHGTDDDLVIGFQLTHSGRFCKPNDKFKMEPHVAYRHPFLDPKFKVTSDSQVWTDEEIGYLIQDYVRAAAIAAECGADFVDIKHCHGYLLHEFLSAYTRPGKYGGSFENRTRILREIIQSIRAGGNQIEIGVRLSAFDFVPFKPDPTLSRPGKPGPGIPEDYSQLVPYKYAFGVDQNYPLQPDLAEAVRFVKLCSDLGVKIVNITAGSPYYVPHIQRPAAYPPSDGYQPPEDPLVGVVRQIHAVRQIKAACGNEVILVGTGYSYLQEYLPHVAQAVIRNGWADMIGLGRMVLSYPTILSDALKNGSISSKTICRTFSDCTTAPRNGMPSGCYPLDKFYSSKPEFQRLKEVKRAGVG